MMEKFDGKNRILWIDIAKAFGIIVVLIVHTGVSLGAFTYLCGMFYIPVFFVIAGYTFKYREDEGFKSFVQRKAKRLLIPYFGYNLCLFVFFFIKDSVLSGNISEDSFFPLLGILYSRYSLYPPDSSSNVYFLQILNSPTWFLTCMFLSCILMWVVMRLAGGVMRVAGLYGCGLLLIAVLIHYVCPVLLPWSLDCALYAAAFMLLGYLAARKDIIGLLYRKPYIWVLAAAVFAGLSYLNGSVNMSVGVYGRSMIVYLAIGTLGSFLVMALSMAVENIKVLKPLSRPLAFIGRHTVPVLCLHLFVYSVISTAVGFIC